MASSASVSNGVVTLTTTLSPSDLGILRPPAPFSEGWYINLRAFKVSVYRALDINDRGEPTNSPYYGSVLSDSYRGRYGVISTDTIPIVIRRLNNIAAGDARSFSTWESFTIRLNTGRGGLRIRDGTRTLAHSGFFSELLTTGSWVIRFRFDFNLPSYHENLRITEVASVSVSGRPPPTAPTAPTTPTAPTIPGDGGGGGGGGGTSPTAPPPGGGGTAPPPTAVVTGGVPVAEWDDTSLFRSFRSPIDGSEVSWFGQRWSDEFLPLRLAWDYFDAQNKPQGSFQIARDIRNVGGGQVPGWGAVMRRSGGVISWASGTNFITGEDTSVVLAGNTSGTNTAFGSTPQGWAATFPDDFTTGRGFSDARYLLRVRDNASPPNQSEVETLYIYPYQGLRLSAITSYDAGTNNLGLQVHYYAAGVTADTQARGNDLLFYKAAIYERGAAEGDRPLAGTVRDFEQTFEQSGAHFVETGWYPGIRLIAERSPTGQALTQAPNFNPNGTRLRVAFDGLTTGNTKGLLPNGDYTARFKVVDFFGNAHGTASYDFSLTRPASIAMTTTPRVYNRSDELQPGTEGLIPGSYIGLDISVTGTTAAADGFHVANGEGGFVLVERREHARDEGDVDETPRIVSDRIRPTGTTGAVGAFRPSFSPLFTDSAGRGVVFRDYRVERRVEYEYRLVAVNRFGNRAYSAWVPAS